MIKNDLKLSGAGARKQHCSGLLGASFDVVTLVTLSFEMSFLICNMGSHETEVC